MASVECRVCSEQISESADICLHCGATQEVSVSTGWFWAGGILSLVGAAIFLFDEVKRRGWVDGDSAVFLRYFGAIALLAGMGLWLFGASRRQRRQERRQAALGKWYCPACEEWLDQPRHWDPEAFDSSLHKLSWYPDDGSMGRPPRPGDSYCNDCAVWVLEGEPHPLGHSLELWRAWEPP